MFPAIVCLLCLPVIDLGKLTLAEAERYEGKLVIAKYVPITVCAVDELWILVKSDKNEFCVVVKKGSPRDVKSGKEMIVIGHLSVEKWPEPGVNQIQVHEISK